MKINPSRSLARSPSTISSRLGSVTSGCDAASRWYLPRWVSRRRIRSTARYRAVVFSQAAGLSGTPSCGHFSIAAMKASCAISSALSRSPSCRISRAIIRGDSTRHSVASRWSSSSRGRMEVSDWSFIGRGGGRVWRCLLRVLLEVFELDDPAYVDPLGADEQREFTRVLDGLGERVHLEDRETTDQLLGFGKWTIDHAYLAVVDLHPGALRARCDTLTREKDSRHCRLLHVLADGGLLLSRGRDSVLHLLSLVVHHHVAHARLLAGMWRSVGCGVTGLGVVSVRVDEVHHAGVEGNRRHELQRHRSAFG